MKKIYSRARPSVLSIEELYQYFATLSGNPIIEELGHPQGKIVVEVPYDGYQYFTRKAIADVEWQYPEEGNVSQATIGYLAVSGIPADEFWGHENDAQNRSVIPIEVPISSTREQLGMLKEDRYKGVFLHQYRPHWPEVYPRPRPVAVTVEIYDERTLPRTILEGSPPDEWAQITHEFSFERSLIFDFFVELALPANIPVSIPPVIRRMSLEWPVATSYHMLELYVGEKGDGDRFVQQPIYYVSEEGIVEWRNIQFQRGALEPADGHEEKGEDTPQFFRAPVMRLQVNEPGELYQKPILNSQVEIELPTVLLSGLETEYFSATGDAAEISSVEKRTTILVNMEIDLEQRFDRRVSSPYQHLRFEGVILEDVRMMDITTLLKDLGFQITPFDSKPYLALIDRPNKREYAVVGSRTEGPDQMNIIILARGMLGKTERETIIPGGKTFKTVVDSGNLVLEMRAELRGNVQKLTSILNTIHTSLKERFRHVSTLE